MYRLVLILLLLGTALGQTPPSPQCSAPEYHQFDFWIGDWDAYDADSPKEVAAHARVEPILNGCSLHEIYDGATDCMERASASMTSRANSGTRPGSRAAANCSLWKEPSRTEQ